MSKLDLTIPTVPTIDKFNLERSMDSLYHICLQYYSTLRIKQHPKIKLITDVMDLLIGLKKQESLDEKDAKKIFDEIHSLAYNNIQNIYDYDKEQDEKKAIENSKENDETIVDTFEACETL